MSVLAIQPYPPNVDHLSNGERGNKGEGGKSEFVVGSKAELAAGPALRGGKGGRPGPQNQWSPNLGLFCMFNLPKA